MPRAPLWTMPTPEQTIGLLQATLTFNSAYGPGSEWELTTKDGRVWRADTFESAVAAAVCKILEEAGR